MEKLQSSESNIIIDDVLQTQFKASQRPLHGSAYGVRVQLPCTRTRGGWKIFFSQGESYIGFPKDPQANQVFILYIPIQIH